MPLKRGEVVLMLYYLVLSQFSVQGRRLTSRTLDDIVLDKHDIQTVATDNGDIYDCLDIYKQPSLRHPLLKHHEVQVKPSYSFMYSEKREMSTVQYAKVSVLKNACRSGTVPIPRARKTKTVFNPLQEGNGIHFAGIQTILNAGRVFRGAAAHMSVYNPKVTPQQSSRALISLQSGPQNEINYIQVGWAVDPILYGNTSTRLFTRWTADNQVKTGCYNLQCNGFIVVHTFIPIDAMLLNISKIDGERFDYPYGVQQHKPTGNWWYFIYDNAENMHTPVGYWPNELFTHLRNGAAYIGMGGQVYSPPGDSSYPPMGSGLFRIKDYHLTSYFNSIEFLSATYVPVIPDNAYITAVRFRCYEANDYSYKTFDHFAYSFLFGGGGGNDLTCIP